MISDLSQTVHSEVHSLNNPPLGILIMHSCCMCRRVTSWIILCRFFDGDKLEEKIRNGIVTPGDIGGPLNERVVRRPDRSGGEDG